MSRKRQAVGWTGERLAAAVLERHGLEVIARNVAVGRGELDIIACDAGRTVAVEVRTITGEGEPMEAFDEVKARQVELLAHELGADRVDVVAVRLGTDAAELRWVPGVD